MKKYYPVGKPIQMTGPISREEKIGKMTWKKIGAWSKGLRTKSECLRGVAGGEHDIFEG